MLSVFGDAVLAKDGSIDRELLGRLVFGDSEARKKLNNATHLPILGEDKADAAAHLIAD